MHMLRVYVVYLMVFVNPDVSESLNHTAMQARYEDLPLQRLCLGCCCQFLQLQLLPVLVDSSLSPMVLPWFLNACLCGYDSHC